MNKPGNYGKRVFANIICILVLTTARPQPPYLNLVIDGSTKNWGAIVSMVQDERGSIWIATYSDGLHQFDGYSVKTFKNEPGNLNSLSSNSLTSVVIDSLGMLWIGSDEGLDKYDPATKTFSHFHHNNKETKSLVNDTIRTLLVDRTGFVWVGSSGGLDKLDTRTNKFTHFIYQSNNESGISNNSIGSICEDHEGIIWAGSGISDGTPYSPDKGGLYRLDVKNGKFHRYYSNPNDPSTLTNSFVSAIYEDKKGVLWVGTFGDGLHSFDRVNNKFIHYPYDSLHPEKLSRPPLEIGELRFSNEITFINEDIAGGLWIGSAFEGINRYDPSTQKTSHYGFIVQLRKFTGADTATGFIEKTSNWPLSILNTSDGMLWVGTFEGRIYSCQPKKQLLPYFKQGFDANTFFEENDSILWVATSNRGIMRINKKTGTLREFQHDPKNPNSISSNTVIAIRPATGNNLWLATENGLNKLNLSNYEVTAIQHDPGNHSSLFINYVFGLFVDHVGNLWLSNYQKGVDKMDIKTGLFKHFQKNEQDSNSLSYNYVTCFAEDIQHRIWVGTYYGLNMLEPNGEAFHHYLKSENILSLYVDKGGVLWSGTKNGLFRLDAPNPDFTPYQSTLPDFELKSVLGIVEDHQQNLWLSTMSSIVRINEKRDSLRVYGGSYGVHNNEFFVCDNYVSPSGELYLGDQDGYYAFHPAKIQDNSIPPILSFTSFRIGSKEILPQPGGTLALPVWNTSELRLNHKQNIFSFDFVAINFANPEQTRYRYMLENYDQEWHESRDHRAYFFSVPPGRYRLHVSAVNPAGQWSEKIIDIMIDPPWWKTWWANLLFVLLGLSIIWSFISLRSRRLRKENRLLEERVSHRTEQLNHSLEELKATQAQLIQSEKMASLGELTAGIAHEIQNPLNFVNNFSEVSNELLDEMKTELKTGKTEEAIHIADDVKQNLEKILHHGKRAEGIVKGMLQHSRSSTGQKEATDINALADEYLRLSYHGLRSKEKSLSAGQAGFNATLITDLDKNVGDLAIIPQDIGRVLLNLYNNAFYSVHEKKKKISATAATYEPLVSVTTKKTNGSVEIRVKDNGNGIPPQIVDKIFQPFFTTKPTGQGTGLGLSLSYDIIKAHGGEISVVSKEGEGSEFIVELPV